jgi:predicted transcriptional regulator
MADKKEIVVYVSWQPRLRLRSPYINFRDVERIKGIFSKERLRILFALKTKNPKSIYQLAKILNRQAKAVKKDLKFLEQLGIVALRRERDKVKKRYFVRPMLLSKEIDVKFVL